MDIAASIQEVIEVILKICKSLKKYSIANICLAGGVALNCVANGKIVSKKILKHIQLPQATLRSIRRCSSVLAYRFK